MSMLAVGTSPSNLKELSRDPSSWGWGLQDISSSDAGRVQDTGNTMYKMRTSQKRKITLTWNQPTAEVTAEILQAFNPEYVYVKYHDAMSNSWEVRQFYVGDRTSMLQYFQIPKLGTRYSTVSFDIVER